MAINIAYTSHTARPAYMQWQEEYDEKMREANQNVPSVTPDSGDVANMTTETMQKLAGRTRKTSLKTHPFIFT